MRCPQCRKQVHPDDIYCIWCSASLRGKSPADPWNCVCGDDTHRSHRRTVKKPVLPRKKKGPLFLIAAILLLSFLPSLLMGAVFFVEALVDEVHTLTVAPEPEPIPAEDAWKLGTPMAQWEDFTVTADSISMDDITGELELIYTAENHTEHTIICADASAAVEGFGLSSLLYLELQPGETVTDCLWIDTDMLQAVDITRIRELTISLALMDGEEYTSLAVTDPAVLTMDFDLPEISMHKGKTTLVETEELTVTLAGHRADPEYGELTLYTLIENRSSAYGTVFMENALCGETDLHLYGYYGIPAGDKLLVKDTLYDIPFTAGTNTVITFDTGIRDADYETAATGTVTMTLSPDGNRGTITSEWE